MIHQGSWGRSLGVCAAAWLIVSFSAAQQSTPPRSQARSATAAQSADGAGATIAGVGGDRHGFLAIASDSSPARGPSLMPGSASNADAAAQSTWLLYHLPASADPGSVVPAGGRQLARPPSAWTVAGESLVLAFTEQAGSAAPAIRVRRLTVRAGGPLGAFVYEPPGRLEALPPLEQADAVIDAASAQQRVFLLTRRSLGESGESGESVEAPGLGLFRLDHAQWTSVALPALDAQLMRERDAASLFRWGDGVGLRLDRSGSEPLLWRLAGPRAIADEVAASDWERVDAPVERSDRLIGVSTQLLAVARSQDDSGFVVRAVREGLRAQLARVEAPAHAAVLPLGELAVFAWTDAAAEDRLRLIALDANTGRVVFDDFARTASPVSPRDVQIILLLAGAALLTALLFALKPEDREAQVELPAGRTLAPPMRRLAAAALDLAPAVAIASLAWDAPLVHALGFPGPDGQGAPLGPPATTFAIWLAHSAVSEWLFGRTIGKALARCRTVRARDGGRPNFRQALLRNVVKTLVAPVTALLLVERWRRHPGDLLAGTIVILDAETVDSEEAARAKRVEPETDAAADTPASGS